MSGRRFLDTNIFLYGLDRGDLHKLRVAEDLVDHALISENGVVSYQVVHEFVSVALKKFPAVMSETELRAYITKVFQRFEVIGSSLELIENALDLRSRYKLSWYDSLIIAAALEAKCDVLYTEDLQHGQRFGELVVTNPFL
jgi:predicted nucleic acid-binding protein